MVYFAAGCWQIVLSAVHLKLLERVWKVGVACVWSKFWLLIAQTTWITWIVWIVIRTAIWSVVHFSFIASSFLVSLFSLDWSVWNFFKVLAQSRRFLFLCYKPLFLRICLSKQRMGAVRNNSLRFKLISANIVLHFLRFLPKWKMRTKFNQKEQYFFNSS